MDIRSLNPLGGGGQDKIVARYNSDTDIKRRKEAEKIYHFYHVDLPRIKDYISETMRSSSENVLYIPTNQIGYYRRVGGGGLGIFSEKTCRVMPKVHFRAFNKVVSLSCTLYDYGVDRYLIDPVTGEIDKDQTDLLLELYKEAGIHEKQKEIYEQAYAFNTVHVEPVSRDGKMQINIYSPNNLIAVPKDNNKYEAKELYIIKYRLNDKGSSDKYFVFWSDGEHYEIDSSGKKINVKDGEDENTDGKNPFEKIPLIKFSLHDGEDYFGKGRLDLVEQNIWYDIRQANLMFVEFYQGFGYGYTVNLGQSLDISPNSFVSVDGVKKDDKDPKMEVVKTDAPMTEIKDNIIDFWKLIANASGVKGSDYEGNSKQMSADSKVMDSKEMETMRIKDTGKATTYETEFFYMFRKVHNLNNKDKKDTKKLLKENLVFHIDFMFPTPDLTPADEIKVWEFELDNNLKTYVDYLIKKNPNLNAKKALKMIKGNIKTNDEIRKLVAKGQKTNDQNPPIDPNKEPPIDDGQGGAN